MKKHPVYVHSLAFENDLQGDSADHLLPGLLCREGRGEEVDILGELLVTIDCHSVNEGLVLSTMAKGAKADCT